MPARRTITLAGMLAAFTVSGVFIYLAATRKLTDLAIYRMGGDGLLHGHALYDLVDPESGLPFTYTPFAALLFAPFSLPPERLTQVVWTVLLLGGLYAFLAHSLRAVLGPRAGRLPRPELVALLAVVIALEPVRNNLALGQINILLGLLIVLDLSGRTGALPRGVLIGVAAGVKLTPLIFLPYLLLTRRRRAAMVGGLTFCATTLVGAAASPRSSWTYWTDVFFDAEHVGGIPYVSNQSLLGVLSRLMSGAEAANSLHRPLTVLIVVFGIGAAVLLTRRKETFLGDLTCALTGLLVSPISWSHHWVWVIPLLLWLGFAADRPRWGRTAGGAGLVLMLAGPIWWVPRTGDAEFTHHGWQLVAANSYFLAAAALLLALGVRAVSAGRRRGPAAEAPATPQESDGVQEAVPEPQRVV